MQSRVCMLVLLQYPAFHGQNGALSAQGADEYTPTTPLVIWTDWSPAQLVCTQLWVLMSSLPQHPSFHGQNGALLSGICTQLRVPVDTAPQQTSSSGQNRFHCKTKKVPSYLCQLFQGWIHLDLCHLSRLLCIRHGPSQTTTNKTHSIFIQKSTP